MSAARTLIFSFSPTAAMHCPKAEGVGIMGTETQDISFS